MKNLQPRQNSNKMHQNIPVPPVPRKGANLRTTFPCGRFRFSLSLPDGRSSAVEGGELSVELVEFSTGTMPDGPGSS